MLLELCALSADMHASWYPHLATRAGMPCGPGASPYSLSRMTGMGARTSSSSCKSSGGMSGAPPAWLLPPPAAPPPRSPPVANCRFTASSSCQLVASSTLIAAVASSTPCDNSSSPAGMQEGSVSTGCVRDRHTEQLMKHVLECTSMPGRSNAPSVRSSCSKDFPLP